MAIKKQIKKSLVQLNLKHNNLLQLKTGLNLNKFLNQNIIQKRISKTSLNSLSAFKRISKELKYPVFASYSKEFDCVSDNNLVYCKFKYITLKGPKKFLFLFTKNSTSFIKLTFFLSNPYYLKQFSKKLLS
jgi:hypothetical protein